MSKIFFSTLLLSLLALPLVSLAQAAPIVINVLAPTDRPVLSSARQIVPGIFLVEGKNLRRMSLMPLLDQIKPDSIAPNWTIISQSDNFIRFKVSTPTSFPAGSYRLYAYPGTSPTISNSSNKVVLIIDHSVIPARRFCADQPIGDLNLDSKVDAKDQKIVADNNIFSTKFFTRYPCADVDNSGKITAADQATLVKCFAANTCGLWPLQPSN